MNVFASRITMAGRSKGVVVEPAWTWEKEFAKPGFKAVPVSAFTQSNVRIISFQGSQLC